MSQGYDGLPHHVTFRNVPGSAITRIQVDGEDRFAFDPATSTFVEFVNGGRREVMPALPQEQVDALRRALMSHSADRRRAFDQAAVCRQMT